MMKLTRFYYRRNVMTGKTAVLAWIEVNFYRNEIMVEEFPFS
ncbi:hypothetical protein [Virgibacillus salidurans]|nr:hypothetical protein [Virgibacillus sp. NKC19-16]